MKFYLNQFDRSISSISLRIVSNENHYPKSSSFNNNQNHRRKLLMRPVVASFGPRVTKNSIRSLASLLPSSPIRLIDEVDVAIIKNYVPKSSNEKINSSMRKNSPQTSDEEIVIKIAECYSSTNYNGNGDSASESNESSSTSSLSTASSSSSSKLSTIESRSNARLLRNLNKTNHSNQNPKEIGLMKKAKQRKNSIEIIRNSDTIVFNRSDRRFKRLHNDFNKICCQICQRKLPRSLENIRLHYRIAHNFLFIQTESDILLTRKHNDRQCFNFCCLTCLRKFTNFDNVINHRCKIASSKKNPESTDCESSPSTAPRPTSIDLLETNKNIKMDQPELVIDYESQEEFFRNLGLIRKSRDRIPCPHIQTKTPGTDRYLQQSKIEITNTLGSQINDRRQISSKPYLKLTSLNETDILIRKTSVQKLNQHHHLNCSKIQMPKILSYDSEDIVVTKIRTY